MVVLAWVPVLRDFEVQQRQEAHGGDGLESTNRLATGLLDRHHVRLVEDCPRGGVTGVTCSLCPIIYTAVRDRVKDWT